MGGGAYSNKWLRAGYGEPLRRFFADQAEFEEIIDFGHAPIFEDADTFPCIIVAHRKVSPKPDAAVHVCPVPRDRPTELSLEQYVAERNYEVPWSRYGADAWSLERPEIDDLIVKIRENGVPLAEFASVKPYRGVLTGFNEAFLVDDTTRLRLIDEDPRSAEIIKPYLRGQDVKRWHPHWRDLWMIVIPSSGDRDWPWADAGEAAESVFAKTYPALHGWFKEHEDRLRKRQDQGWHWWELRACDYYNLFDDKKIVYQEIQFHPQYAFSDSPLYGNNKVFLIPSADLYLLSCLNSPTLWC